MDENKDKLTEGDKSAVQAAIAKVNEAIKGDDAAAINAAVEDLGRASQAMAEHLYAASAAAGRRDRRRGRGRRCRRPGPPPAGKPDDVIDVEFEEKK